MGAHAQNTSYSPYTKEQLKEFNSQPLAATSTGDRLLNRNMSAEQIKASIKELITRGSSQDEIEIQAKKEGMSTILEDGILKAAQGLTTLEEVFRVVSE